VAKTKHTHIHIHTNDFGEKETCAAYDAGFEENKHPRSQNGQFGAGNGSSGGRKSKAAMAQEKERREKVTYHQNAASMHEKTGNKEEAEYHRKQENHYRQPNGPGGGYEKK
jgi:hypothetical protein